MCSDDQLVAATRIVMGKLDLKEHEGLRKDVLKIAQDHWIEENKDTVRCAINDWRNYVQGEFYKLFKTLVADDHLDQVPNHEQILDIAIRKDNFEGTDFEEFLDFYWDELIPKVAGHSKWGPGKRHHGLLSSMKPRDDPDAGLYVTPSDEAFACLLWENCFDRWRYSYEQDLEEELKINDPEAYAAKKQAEQAKKEAEAAKKKPAKSNKKGAKKSDEEPEDAEEDDGAAKTGKESSEAEGGNADSSDDVVEVVDPRSVAPYTLPKGGVNKFGGWNKAGRKRYRQVLELIKKSKKKKNLEDIEKACLQRLRIKYDCEERESKRRKTKHVEEEDDAIDSDHEADWML